MSVGVDVKVTGLGAIRRALKKAGGLDLQSLFEDVTAEVESQTRRRIQDEKEGPDGKKWPAWSPGYARTRHGGHSLLESTGALVDSIQSDVGPRKAQVGTNLVYARIHQLGARRGRSKKGGIPARPFLGISKENTKEIDDVVKTWLTKNGVS